MGFAIGLLASWLLCELGWHTCTLAVVVVHKARMMRRRLVCLHTNKNVELLSGIV